MIKFEIRETTKQLAESLNVVLIENNEQAAKYRVEYQEPLERDNLLLVLALPDSEDDPFLGSGCLWGFDSCVDEPLFDSVLVRTIKKMKECNEGYCKVMKGQAPITTM